MYKQFFGFKERPFRLVPNPDYLYLSRSHEEALGHLNYAVRQGEGFVEITGEIGTGKTTLCRTFLENLDDNTEAAFIFNPKLDSIQLLKEINREFGISSDGITTRDLIETLNSFLMEKRKDGKTVILLIDEAQNLTKDVLEQLRLLSNLETTTSKLIQVILVGQPELGDLLDSRELRQLSQRITLRAHLIPLTLKETKEYIRHRIRVASHKTEAIFTGEAFRIIYQYSSGIPRLINIVCDRALLTAFTMNSHKISGKVVRSSIKELEGGRQGGTERIYNRTKSAVLLASLVIILSLSVFFQPMLFKDDPFHSIRKTTDTASQNMLDMNDANQNLSTETKMLKIEDSTPDEEENLSPSAHNNSLEIESDETAGMGDTGIKNEETDVTESEGPEIISEVDIPDILRLMNTATSRMDALENCIRLWGTEAKVSHYLEGMDDDNEFFRVAAKQSNFMCSRLECNFADLKKYNLPTILELYSQDGLSPKFVTISSIDESTVRILKDDNTVYIASMDELDDYWLGTAYIVWKNFFNYTGIIPVQTTRDSIITLKIHLRKLGFDTIEISPFYDKSTLTAVKEIQKRNGLQVDGIVGPITMIVLYNEDDSLTIPHISNPAPDMPG